MDTLIEQTNNSDKLVKMSELAKISGLRYSTIKFYSEIGILPFLQQDKRLVRRYEAKKALERLEEIKKLKLKGHNIKDMINLFVRK